MPPILIKEGIGNSTVKIRRRTAGNMDRLLPAPYRRGQTRLMRRAVPRREWDERPLPREPVGEGKAPDNQDIICARMRMLTAWLDIVLLNASPDSRRNAPIA